jgi:hypothetical protein
VAWRATPSAPKRSRSTRVQAGSLETRHTANRQPQTGSLLIGPAPTLTRARRPACRLASRGGRAPARRASGLSRQCLGRGGAMALPLEGAPGSARAGWRWAFRSLTPCPAGGSRTPFRAALGARRRSWQLHTRASSLGETDRDGLLRRGCAVLALADVVHLLANELTCLRTRRLALTLVATRTPQRFLFRHLLPPSLACIPRSRSNRNVEPSSAINICVHAVGLQWPRAWNAGGGPGRRTDAASGLSSRPAEVTNRFGHPC